MRQVQGRRSPSAAIRLDKCAVRRWQPVVAASAHCLTNPVTIRVAHIRIALDTKSPTALNTQTVDKAGLLDTATTPLPSAKRRIDAVLAAQAAHFC